MVRLLVCLPVCLLLAPAYPRTEYPDTAQSTTGPTRHERSGTTDALLVLGANPWPASPPTCPG